MASYPSDLKYTKDHEWARVEGDRVRVGITKHAVEALGDITLVDLPKVGAKVEAHANFGTVESVKAVSELFAPVAGSVAEVNAELGDKPELINEDCYGKGWMIVLEGVSGLDALMDAAAYEAYLGTLDH